MDQRLDANERRIEHRMNERMDANERRIEQVLGLHQTRLDEHDAELSSQRRLLEDLRSEIGQFRRNGVEQSRQFGDLSSDTSSTVGSSNSFLQAEWCPRTVLVRGWAPFDSPASQKIDRIEYKKVANELLSCLPHCLQNNVMVPDLLWVERWWWPGFVPCSARFLDCWCGVKHDQCAGPRQVARFSWESTPTAILMTVMISGVCWSRNCALCIICVRCSNAFGRWLGSPQREARGRRRWISPSRTSLLKKLRLQKNCIRGVITNRSVCRGHMCQMLCSSSKGKRSHLPGGLHKCRHNIMSYVAHSPSTCRSGKFNKLLRR